MFLRGSIYGLVGLGASWGLLRLSQANFLLFHCLVAMFGIVIGVSAFVVAWNARSHLRNNYLLLVGISLGFVSVLEGVHTLAYQGMQVFPTDGPNEATQLWVGAISMAALSFLAAPFFLARRLRPWWTLGVYVVLTAAILFTIFGWRVFPDCFVTGHGLTPFKIYHGYFASLCFIGAIAYLYIQRSYFTRKVFWEITTALGLHSVAVVVFTFYTSPFGFSNALGHVISVGALYFIYRALVETGIRQPFALLFRELNDSREALAQMNEDLMLRVESRTEDLTRTLGILKGQIRERRRVEESLRRYSQRLETLHQLGKSILSAQSLEDVVAVGLARARDLLPCVRVSVVLLRGSGGGGRILDALGTFPEEVHEVGMDVPLDLIGIDQLLEGRIYLDNAWLVRPGGRIMSRMSLPLRAGDRLIGALNFVSEEENAFAPEQVDIAGEVSDQLAMAMEQARLHRKVESYAQEMEARVALRTAELESFIYSVSHDLRTPLRAINGFASLLNRRKAQSLDAEGQEMVREIVNASLHMGKLIDGLLVLSRLERQEIHLGEVDLSRVMERVRAILGQKLRKSKARLEVAESLPKVIGDETLLIEVMTNLLDNALIYTRANCVPEIHVDCSLAGREVILAVRDNGIGIPESSRERIFNVFQRLHTNEEYPGTGVGLSIVRKCVHRMGGRIEVDGSQEEPGATFLVRLQAAEPEEESDSVAFG